jgi:hypothetical protein
VVLGSTTPIPAGRLTSTLEVGLTVGAQELSRQELHATPHALSVDGAVRLSAAPSTCGPTTAGALRWAASELSVCTGATWAILFSTRDGLTQATAARSCRAIKDQFPTAGSAAYWIDPDGDPTSNAYHLWCDMATDDGGWTLVASIQNGGPAGQPGGTGEYNVALLDDSLTPVGSAKVPDATINLIGSEFRHTIHSPSTYKRFYRLNHPFANATGQVTTGDQCRASVAAAWVDVTTGPSTHSYGLASTAPGDGCGSCVDRCGGGTASGSWWSWYNYFASSSNNGSYIQLGGVGYTNGWMYVR